ncbi:hypothetical protein OIU77_011057 [Salix suchowensis]|uniref:Uncharacterized protein n=1 Tax=Salix suchowensis TaxID=1278906 RepID=A0ABQ9ABL2_9ROSI|nr:hypothetical protein OIU77_011057 [Salix suchowensis]
MIPFVTLSRPERKIIPVNGNCSFSSRRTNMAALLAKATVLARGKDEVYVAATPLRATKGPAKLLMSTAYSLNLWDLQHFVVIIKPNSPPPQNSQVLDFLVHSHFSVFQALKIIPPISGLLFLIFSQKILKISSLRLQLYQVEQYQELFLCGSCQSYREANVGLLDPRS